VTLRIGLLRLDDLPEHAVHVRGDYPDLYADLFAEEGVDLVDVPVHRGAVPDSLDDADVWVFTGSRHSVYDGLPWIDRAAELVRAAIDEERPAVGICFGHQLFAHALGGRVEPAGRWGLGVQRYRTTDPLPWFPEGDESISLIASHQDQVIEPPPGSTVWSTSDYCPVAGLRIGAAAWSVQGHPEFTAEVAHVLYEGRRDRLGDEAVDRARDSLTAPVSNRDLARAIVTFAAERR
jgi:GMP synthase-like glutamine amidotransferase